MSARSLPIGVAAVPIQRVWRKGVIRSGFGMKYARGNPATACSSRTPHELIEMLVSYPALRRTTSDVKSEMADAMKAVNG